MRVIEGYKEARKVLARRVGVELFEIGQGLKQQLIELFDTEKPEEVVRRIINDVFLQGDSALYSYTQKIDRITLTTLELCKKDIKNAYQKVSTELTSSMKTASQRISAFYQEQKNHLFHGMLKDGLGQLVRPLQRIGIYAPGGTACYPSTVLMTAIPARIAGVGEIILVTPPDKTGKVPPATLIAADLAQVDRIFSIGGAQAIAALAFGTESIPQVDKICGPGNIFVTLAKKQVFGRVAIDGLQGPSEIFIIADESAEANYCAADILAQAEHDRLASAILATTSSQLANEVNREIKQQLQTLNRQEIALEAIANNGVIAIVTTIDEAIDLANLYAPEHLSLMIKEANYYVNKLRNVGCIFIGEYSTVPIGDYVAGPSHALPTNGTARFSSPLNLTDFIKITDLIHIDREAMKQLGPVAITLANAEGLQAHTRAVQVRLENI